MPDWQQQILRLGEGSLGALAGVAAFAAALGLALLAHAALWRLARHVAMRSRSVVDDQAVASFTAPSRLLLLCFVALAAAPALPLDAAAEASVRRLIGLALIAAVGWMMIGFAQTLRAVVELRHDISVADNLRARRARTRAGILYRIAIAAIVVIVGCLMLMSFPSVRHVGLTLFASAGLAGLAVGAAAQPALKNLIAGIQLAFTEPIRIDDVVVIEGEWGRIEEIRLTYVVVRLWDERRLVVPVSKFLEAPFQNWTRRTADIVGTVLFYLDYSVPVDRLRAKLGEIVEASPLWDRKVCLVQVTDLKEHVVEVRALVSAGNAGDAFDLRCEVRERMIDFIRRDFPAALPRLRAELEALPGETTLRRHAA